MLNMWPGRSLDCHSPWCQQGSAGSQRQSPSLAGIPVLLPKEQLCSFPSTAQGCWVQNPGVTWAGKSLPGHQVHPVPDPPLVPSPGHRMPHPALPVPPPGMGTPSLPVPIPPLSMEKSLRTQGHDRLSLQASSLGLEAPLPTLPWGAAAERGTAGRRFSGKADLEQR